MIPAPADLVPLETHAQRMAAIRAIPRAAELYAEGQVFYGGLLYLTYTGLARHWTTWRTP
jgi:hypothetical protein